MTATKATKPSAPARSASALCDDQARSDTHSCDVVAVLTANPQPVVPSSATRSYRDDQAAAEAHSGCVVADFPDQRPRATHERPVGGTLPGHVTRDAHSTPARLSLHPRPRSDAAHSSSAGNTSRPHAPVETHASNGPRSFQEES